MLLSHRLSTSMLNLVSSLLSHLSCPPNTIPILLAIYDFPPSTPISATAFDSIAHWSMLLLSHLVQTPHFPSALSSLEQAAFWKGHPQALIWAAILLWQHHPTQTPQPRVWALFQEAISCGGFVDSWTKVFQVVRCCIGLELEWGLLELTLLKRSIDLDNDAWAMHLLGTALLFGHCGVPMDVRAGIALLEKGAALGHHDCMFQLAASLEEGEEGLEKNMEMSLQIYRNLVDMGHPDAMYTLAELLSMGEGGDDQFAEVVDLLERAIDIGFGNEDAAMYSLATLVKSGTGGLPVQKEKAIALLEELVQRGHVDSMKDLAELMLDCDPQRSVELYQAAIDAHHIDTHVIFYQLGKLLVGGNRRVKPDVERAACLFERGLRGNHRGCSKNLAELLWRGHGTKKCAWRAVNLLKICIVEGDVEAMKIFMNMLQDAWESRDVRITPPQIVSMFEQLIPDLTGSSWCTAVTCYATVLRLGLGGVRMQPLYSARLYCSAIRVTDAKSPEPLVGLAKLLWRGKEGIRKDINAAILMLTLAVDMDDPEAMCTLGLILEDWAEEEGEINQNTQAKQLYEWAIEQATHVGAMMNLGRMYEYGQVEGDEEDQLQRASWLYIRALRKGSACDAAVGLARVMLIRKRKREGTPTGRGRKRKRICIS